jgi:hypothetical protein
MTGKGKPSLQEARVQVDEVGQASLPKQREGFCNPSVLAANSLVPTGMLPKILECGLH